LLACYIPSRNLNIIISYHVLKIKRARWDVLLVYVNHTTVSGLCVGSFVNHILWNTLKKSRTVLFCINNIERCGRNNTTVDSRKNKQKGNKKSFVKQKHFLIKIWNNDMGGVCIIESLLNVMLSIIENQKLIHSHHHHPSCCMAPFAFTNIHRAAALIYLFWLVGRRQDEKQLPR
jgi:hypothetical protein